MIDTRRVALVAYLTLLPPRCLQGSEGVALDELRETCLNVEPYEVLLGGVETFVPVTPTLFIRVAGGAERMIDLHNRMNRSALATEEQWPYMPHLTIAKMNTEDQARKAASIAHERWEQFTGSRRVLLAEFTFVRELEPNYWRDVASIPLGRSVTKR